MILNPQKLVDDGFVKGDGLKVQQNGIDLTLESAERVLTAGAMSEEVISPALGNNMSANSKGFFCFEKGKSYSILTNQDVKVPDQAAAFVHPRSTMNRMGAFCVAGVYDSGFDNRIGFTLYCFNDIRIKKGTRIAQIVFISAAPASLYKGQYNRKTK
jgi:deoxycytidine triphosphate deaminase